MTVAMEAQGLTVRLGQRAVVTDLSFALNGGAFAVLVGPNGAGKTTVMRALAGLLPSAGTILVEGRALSDLDARARARRIAYLPQGHVFHWPMAVADVVALGRHPHADPFSPRTADDAAAVTRALRLTGLGDLARRPVTTLSGGERARVALARALATEAPILLADEPTASLDPRHQLVVMALMREVARRGGAVLAIIHDLALAARFADRVLVMQDGRLAGHGAPREALTPQIIARVFGVDTFLVETSEGPLPLPRHPL